MEWGQIRKTIADVSAILPIVVVIFTESAIVPNGS